MSTDEPTCPSCNVSWREHPGIIAICRELQEAKKEVTRLEAALASERNDAEWGRAYQAVAEKIDEGME